MKQRSAGKPDIELGKRIRLRRVEQKISQAELGDKLGVSFQQVQKYEKGVNRVGAWVKARCEANGWDTKVHKGTRRGDIVETRVPGTGATGTVRFADGASSAPPREEFRCGRAGWVRWPYG